MKTTLRLLAFLLLMPLTAIAQQNPTTELLGATYATRFIRIGLVPDALGSDKYTLQYGIDDYRDLDPLVDGLVLRTDRGTDVYIANFNPLQQSFTVNAVATADVSYATLKSFYDDLVKAQANVQPTPPAVGGGAFRQGGACAELNATIVKLHGALENEELSPATLKKRIDGANNFLAVEQAAAFLEGVQTAIDANITTIDDAVASLANEFSSLGGASPTKDCPAEVAALERAAADAAATQTLKDSATNARGSLTTILKEYADFRKSIADVRDSKQKLSASIAAILKDLKPYRVRSRWRGPFPNDDSTLTDWDFTKVSPNFVNEQKVTVMAKAKDVEVAKNLLVVREFDASKKTADFRIRQDSLLIPERAVAVVYNNLKYPKYATKKNEAGKTVVDRTEEKDPWNGALLLNLVIRLRRLSVANPMIQLGVSTAKDYPGLLAGAGLRFTEPVAFSLSFGGMITRYKDLDDQLQVGSEVTGDADIDKHLELRTSPIVPYLAVQIKF